MVKVTPYQLPSISSRDLCATRSLSSQYTTWHFLSYLDILHYRNCAKYVNCMRNTWIFLSMCLRQSTRPNSTNKKIPHHKCLQSENTCVNSVFQPSDDNINGSFILGFVSTLPQVTFYPFPCPCHSKFMCKRDLKNTSKAEFSKSIFTSQMPFLVMTTCSHQFNLSMHIFQQVSTSVDISSM